MQETAAVLLQVLCFRKETIEHKLATLTGECGIPASVIAIRHALIGYSLEKRILPRMKAICAREEQHSVEVESDVVTKPKKISTKGRRRIRLKQHYGNNSGVQWNVNAIYLSDERFERYLETSEITRRRRLS